MRNLFLGLLALFVSLGVATLNEAHASAEGSGYESPPSVEVSLAGEICTSQGVAATTLSLRAALPARRFIWKASNPWSGFEDFPFVLPGYRCYQGDCQLSWSTYWNWGGRRTLLKRWLELQARFEERRKRRLKALEKLQEASRCAPPRTPASPLRKRLPVIASTLLCMGAAGGPGTGLEPFAMGAVAVSAFDATLDFVKANPYSRLGRLLGSVTRKMGHQPVATVTILDNGGETPQIIIKADGRDNIGLNPFAEAFELPRLPQNDVLFLEATGVKQELIVRAATALSNKGYRPVGPRLMIRVHDEKGNRLDGASYIEAIDALLGTFTDVRSYFSLGSAPALHQVKVPKAGLHTPREGGADKEVLFFAGKAKEIFPGLNGTEGGLPTSQGAMVALYGKATPAQPRIVLRLRGKKFVLIKGNHAVKAMRAFEDPSADGGYVFLTRGHFGEDEAGKEAWRQGYDFLWLEDDTPKGPNKDSVKVESGYRKINANGRLSGWIIAEPSSQQGNSLVSYQVLALLAEVNGDTQIADLITELVESSVKRGVELVKRDFDELEVKKILGKDKAEQLRDWFAAKAPQSSKSTRKNHLGFGAKMHTGYVHMASLFNPGHMVVGDQFGLSKFQIRSDKTKGQPCSEEVCGGKNPILDHNQTFVGLAWRLKTITTFRDAVRDGTLSDEQRSYLIELLGSSDEQWLDTLNWILAYSPSLTRGSILMNAEDVAALAGDDDGDQLWFSFRNDKVHKVFVEIKRQNKGCQNYSIENNKGAQLPSSIGSRRFREILDAEGEELDQMITFVMAPNKGQGPVGYLANLCTILITFFQKVDNGRGGLRFKNVWVERLQAALNLMQQTSIDMQKRIFGALCLLRWTLADLRKEVTPEKGLVPGFNYPVLGHAFSKEGFDPNNFSKEEYARALKEIEVPNIPHHYSGQLMPAVTEMDSMYSIAALGSWLVWESISLVATGKPCDWGMEMHEDAKGGLDPYALAEQLQSGEQLLELLGDLSPETKEKVEALWVERPRELYAWKTQSKRLSFTVPAPPALELNHEVALAAEATYVPDSKPELNYGAVQKALSKAFKLNMSEREARRFVNDLLAGFYREAGEAQRLKTASARFQSAHERSGVEALRYLLEALEAFRSENRKYKKLAQGMEDALTPSMKMSNKDEAITACTLLFGWKELTESSWAFDQVAKLVESEFEARKAVKKTGGKTQVWRDFGFTEKEAKSAVRGKASRLYKEDFFLAKCESYLGQHYGEDKFARMKARATWFVDEGLTALVKSKTRQEIVASKKDILRDLKGSIQVWTEHRSSWTEKNEVEMEILLATFKDGEALWIDPVKQDLEELAEKRLDDDDRRILNGDLIRAKVTRNKKELSFLRKLSQQDKRAQNAHSLLNGFKELAENQEASPTELLDRLCSSENPFAADFVQRFEDSLGPLLNLERAWQRATPEERETVQGWTWELGYWHSYNRMVDGQRQKVTKFYADSRVEWSLPDADVACLCRVLLEDGVSFYKLTKVPGRINKTWRLFDAFVYQLEPLNDWQLANGFGHLVSLAVPEGKDKKDFARVDHVGLLNSEKEYYQNQNPDELTWEDQRALEGVKAELSRIENLEKNGLMGRWGHLYFPITWGFEKHRWAGQLTCKKLQGRAWMALSILGRNNPTYHEQPLVDEDGITDISSTLKPHATNGNHMPWKRRFARDSYGSYDRRRRASMQQRGALELDDSVDLLPYDLGDDARVDYNEWLDFIEGVAESGMGSTQGLTMSSLWFKSHAGRFAVMDPANEIYDPEVAQKCGAKLAACPSYDARLHIEVLLRSEEWVKPVWPTTSRSAAQAFFSVIRIITDK